MNEILPLAFTMLAGPQIITAIILVTAKRAIKSSLAYILGVALAASFGIGIFYEIAKAFHLQLSTNSGPTTFEKTLQTIIIVLLFLAAFKTYFNRAKVTLPKWMGKLENATPGTAFKTALILILLMPSDLAIMFTVGLNRASHNSDPIEVLPFIALTTLITALPLLLYLIFRKEAVKVMPAVRAWIENNSWVVSCVAYLIFIILLW